MRGFKRVFLVLLTGLMMISITANPPVKAASFFDSVSLSLEKEIGQSAYQEEISKKKVVHLPKRQEDHLNILFDRLARQSVRYKEVKYSLTVIQDDSFNAYALPGGAVFVHTGLLSFVHNDSELAGVLGHEIAHIDRRHSMQAITRAVGATVILSLAMGGKNNNRRKTIAELAAVALSLSELGYSREAEFQADKYGVMFMQRAGYNKQDLINMWYRVHNQLEGGKSQSKAATLFSTHPPTMERIKRIEAM